MKVAKRLMLLKNNMAHCVVFLKRRLRDFVAKIHRQVSCDLLQAGVWIEVLGFYLLD